MATEAQIRANRANAQKSKGPKTAEGKARARLNALKHGLRAAAAVDPTGLTAPHEDLVELAARVLAWVNDYKPEGPIERGLVERAARLSWTLDRAERYEAAILAQRVRAAMLDNQSKRVAEVRDLARKLLYMTGKSPNNGPDWVDQPAAFAAALRETPEGVRWMIDRWTEIQLLIHSGAEWNHRDRHKFIRLMGKRPVDADDDPELNAIVQAYDAVAPDSSVDFWTRTRDLTPSEDPAFNAWRTWRVLVAAPADGRAFLASIVARELDRLNKRLSVVEEVEGTAAVELAERALFSAGDAAERLRRHQTARSRELLRTLDALAKLRKAREAKTVKKSSNEPKVEEPPRPREAAEPEPGGRGGRDERVALIVASAHSGIVARPSILLPPGAGGTPLVGSGRRPDEGRRVRGRSRRFNKNAQHAPKSHNPHPAVPATLSRGERRRTPRRATKP